MSILYFRNSDGKFVQIPSIPGKSAYEIAVEKGVFQGTEEEFARHQIFENKDILDQITQENIDLWTEGGNIDLTPYQTIEEDTLITEAKDIPGAINELYDSDIELDRDGADSIKVFEGYPDLSTDDKTIIGAINELDYRLENISDIIDVQLSGSLSDHIEYQHPLVNTTDDLELINPRKLSDGTLAFVKEEAKYYYYTKADGWQELKTGGTGSGGGATSAYISSTASENLIVATDNDLELPLDFNSPNAGRGILKVFINDVNSANISLAQGETTVTIDSELFKKGDNTLTVYALDRVGVMSNSLTFYVRYGGTEITTDFDSDSSYDYGSVVRFYFVASALDTSQMLSFSMKIDGELHGTISCSSDIRSYYTFPNTLSVGSHRCEAWAESEDGAKSNVLTFNLVILDNTSLVISADGNKATIEEGAQLSLGYKVFMKNNSSFITKTYVDEQLVNTGTCGLAWNYYKTSSLTEGIHSVKVEVCDVTETVSDYVIWIVTVTGSTYEMVQPTTAGAVFLASALNMNNSSETRNVWNGVNQDNQVVSANLYNFAFNSESGWVDDELLITGNSYVEIPITPLAENAKYGFTLDIEFRTKPIGVEDTEVLRLWNDEDNCGILITTDSLLLQSKDGNKCDLYFTEDEIVSAIFIIDRNECTAKIYLNGVMCEAFHLSDYVIEGEKFLEDFTVNNHVIIGGKDKNGYSAIRNLRIYEVALATNEILNNFISNEKNKEKQKALVEFQKGDDLPTLTIYGDFSGLGKDDKKPCDIVYVSPDTNKYGESFTLSGKYSQLQYQGTSSMQYPIKNYRINPRDKDGKKKINPFNGGKPESRFTLKADFMTSNHAHNTGMAKFISDKLYNYNNNDEKTMNPMRWHLLQNGEDVNSVRETINGFPCRLILVNDGESALNEGQAEPTPGNTKDMGIFNFNNDKDNLNTMGMDTDIFPNCISYEVTANSDTSAGAFVPFSEPITIKVKSSYIPISLIGTVGVDVISNSTNNFSYWSSMCDKDKKRLNWNNQFPKTITSDTVYFEVTWDNNERIVKTSTGRTILFILDTELNEEYLVITNKELEYLQNSFELRYPDADDVGEDYGYLGIMVDKPHIEREINGDMCNRISVEYFGTHTLTITTGNGMKFDVQRFGEDKSKIDTSYNHMSGSTVTLLDNVHYIGLYGEGCLSETITINGIEYIMKPILDKIEFKDPHMESGLSQDYGLKRVIDWVGNCTDEEFVADFDKYFNKHYTLRYYLLVVLIGAVDNLGKNLMLDTWDGQIWYPRFYDIDTILSYDNSGAIKFDVDIEMEQGYWNTSASRLWTKVRDYMHDELVEVYKDMRGNGVTYENIMRYMYDEQIAKIPQTYYNKDFDIKYAPYADEYLGKAHGDGYQHMKRWLKNRFIFCDTLFDYAPSYENDKLTIRANTLDLMSLEIETYTPVYQHISFYNGQMSKEKVDGKTSTIFEGTAQTATDQEVLIYGGSNIKKISGISSMNPDSMLIGNATRLTELIATDCPLLTEINSDKANLLPNVYLNKVDLSGCPLLGGMLKISNSQLLQNLNMKGTAITGVQLPSSIRNLEVLRLPNTLSSLTLNDAPLLHTLEFDNGINLQSISLKNCNRLDNCINFDLTQTPTVVLDNSYNTEELYMSATTNLTLKNMPSLKRVIFTPNSEYSTFDINNVLNSANYKITTFNNPMMTDFITTAPHRLSYKNGEYGDITPNTAFTANTLDLADTQFQNVKFLCTTDIYNLKVPTSMKNFYCDSAMDIDTDVIEDASYEVIHEELIEPYTTNYEGKVYRYDTSSFTIEKGIVSDYIDVVGGTMLPFYKYESLNVKITEYDENKNEIKITHTSSNGWKIGQFEIQLEPNTRYIIANCANSTVDFTLQQPYTPNIIPSSANGSLIFNMYSNNTTQPTSTSPYMWDLTGLKLEDFYTYGMNNWVKQDENNNITMPQRMPGYSVRLVNADITPDEYPTMLYPKLIDTTLPITGKLDYTKYNGTSLAWAYAYTTDDVNINPLGSREQVNITNDYNKLYGTDFIDIVDVWIYKDTDVSNLSTNENIKKAYIELTKDNGTTRLNQILPYYPNCTDLYFFEDGSITALNNLFDLYVSKRSQILNVTFMDGYFENLINLNRTFKGASNLQNVNNIPKSVIYMQNTFENCSKFNQQLDLSELNILKDNLSGTFYGCTSLTHTPILPSNYTGSMQGCFQNCSSLTEAPTIPSGVTNMQDTFNGCTSLTTIPNIPSSCEYYDKTFYNCTKLSSIPIDGWKGYFYRTFYKCISLNQQINITNATLLDSVFEGCSSLTTPPILPSNYTGGMQRCFSGCTSLTQAPVIPEGVTNVSYCFHGCSKIKEIVIPYNCRIINNVAHGCKSLSNITIPLTYLGFNDNGELQKANYLNVIFDTNNLVKITWVGETTHDLDIPYMCSSTPFEQQNNIQELVPEHLADLGTPYLVSNGTSYIDIPAEDIQYSKITEIELKAQGGYGEDTYIVGANGEYNQGRTEINLFGSAVTAFIFGNGGSWYSISHKDGEVVKMNTTGVYLDDTQKTAFEPFTDNRSHIQNTNFRIFGRAGYQAVVHQGGAKIYHLIFRNGNTVLNNFIPHVDEQGVACIIDTVSNKVYYDTTGTNGLSYGTVVSSGATLTLGETYGAYLTPDEVFSANAKGWTIEGASSDFTIINASDDVSGYTTDENVLSCFIELTNDNYTTRIDEVLQWYPNCTDLYFFEDGSITTLKEMFRCANIINNYTEGNNRLYYTQIQNITFVNGYFENCTSLDGAFPRLMSLVSINNIPNSVTNMNGTFVYDSVLTRVDFPSSLVTMDGTFDRCSGLLSVGTIPSSVTVMKFAFQECTSLEITPNIPNGVTNMQNTFYNCISLTTPPTIPDGVTNMQNTFYNCISLTTAPTIPQGVTNMYGCFQSCSALTTPPIIPEGVASMYYTFAFSGITTPPNIPSTATTIEGVCRQCTSLTTMTIPFRSTITNYWMCIHNSPITDITWEGEVESSLDISRLDSVYQRTQADIQELVPEHLADLYRDKAIFDFSKKEITINNTKTTLE